MIVQCIAVVRLVHVAVLVICAGALQVVGNFFIGAGEEGEEEASGILEHGAASPKGE